MPEKVLIDNDIALKVACYSLVDELVSCTSVEDTPPAILGVGKFVIRDRIARGVKLGDVARAKAAFEHLLTKVSFLEPDGAELLMAADFESEANRRDLELDGGESQLLAILVNRAGRLLITGDKRAIRAIAIVAKFETEKRIACLEQLLTHLVKELGIDTVRKRIRNEPKVDRTASICFSCSNSTIGSEEVLNCLSSYISHLNVEAPGVLLPGLDLATLQS